MNQEELKEIKNQSLNQTPKTITADEVKKESIQMPNETKSELKAKKKALKKSLKRPKQKQKTDYINLLLALAICFLFLIIIAPPILRKTMPKTVIIPNTKNENAIILSCVGINAEEQYKINSRTKYIDEDIKQNIITYTKLTNEELANEIKVNPIISASANNEIVFFQTIKELNIDINQSTTVVSIQDYAANKNTSNFNFMYYFQEKEKQKAFYTSQGYSCTEIKD